ncbi:MAG: DMT family transporter [Deltaproteobacteria bacterium]|nr:DMT family transporter [Deltaproteobacteria bacterium]
MPYLKIYSNPFNMSMYIGELSALLASVIWATGATFFTLAVEHIGPYRLNFIRLNLALFMLFIVLVFTKGSFFPDTATFQNVLWLSISGVLGLALGDLCYFGALRYLGVRITMLFFTLAPPAAAFSEWLFLRDAISAGAFAGMGIVIAGIITVITGKRENNESRSYPLKGIFLAITASLLQGLGLTISKSGMKGLDALDSTYLRMLSASLSFSLFYLLFRRHLPLYDNKRGRIVYVFSFFGAFFGPFLGVILSMNSIRYTHSGIAQTLLSLTPVTIIPFSVFVFGERITLRSVSGTLLALAGVFVLIFLK